MKWSQREYDTEKGPTVESKEQKLRNHPLWLASWDDLPPEHVEYKGHVHIEAFSPQ